MKIIKVYASKRFDLKPGSSPVVPTDFEVTIPPHHYGTFYIRECLGSQGVDSPNSVFHAGWHGKPRITLTHSGGQDVCFTEGMEIGELHIRYAPPSPYFGDQMELEYPFMIAYKDDNTTEVTTNDGKIFRVDKVIVPAKAITDKLIRNLEFVHRHLEFTPKAVMVQYELISYGDLDHMKQCNSLIPFKQDRMLSHYENHFGLAKTLLDRQQLGELATPGFDPQLGFEVPDFYKVVLTPTGYAFRKDDKTVMVTANLYREGGASTLLSMTPNKEYELSSLKLGNENGKFKANDCYYRAKDLPGIAGSVSNDYFSVDDSVTSQITVAYVLDGKDAYYAIQTSVNGPWVRLSEYNRIFIYGTGLHQQEIDLSQLTLNSSRTYAPTSGPLRYQSVLPISEQRIFDLTCILRVLEKRHYVRPPITGTGHELLVSENKMMQCVTLSSKPIYYISNGALEVAKENEILLNHLRKDAEIYCSHSHRVAEVIRHAILHTNVRDETLENTAVLRLLYKAAIKVLIRHTKTNIDKPQATKFALELAEMLAVRLRVMSIYDMGRDYYNLIGFLSERGIGWTNPELIFKYVDLRTLSPNPLIE